MEFAPTAEQLAIRDTAQAFITKELLPLEAEALRRERSGLPAMELLQIRALQLRAKEFGFWGMSTPTGFGGMELPAVTQSLVFTELGRTFIPFSFGGEADNILYEAEGDQRSAYLLPTIAGERVSCFAITEPSAGSDAAGIRMRARRDGADWILDGEKTFITNGDHADFAIVIAVTDPERGAREGSTAFLVDREMGWTSSPIPTMGEGGPASLFFNHVRVPGGNVLGQVGKGFELAMRWIGRGRFIIPSRAVGACERLLSMALEHARQRRTFGRPIADNQAIQWMIADCEVDLESFRWLTLLTAWTIDQGRDARHASSMAKLAGAANANRIVDRVLQIHGGMGYTRELPIERWYREMRLLRIFEGTDEMQRLILSRDLIRGYTRIGGHLA